VRLTRNLKLAGIGLALALSAVACSDNKENQSDRVREREQGDINGGFDRLANAQQVPTFDYSQERQTLIDVLTARAEGTHGTAYARALDGTLIWWCPTVGAPVPSTYQLTNPDQIVTPGPRERGTATVPLGEPSGVYTGASAATWTLCLDDQGTPFAQYEEANVGWTAGIVNGLPAEQRAQVDEITFEFTTEEPGG
jgi:hypothetical protein